MEKRLILFIFPLIILMYNASFAQEKSPPKGEVAADSDSYMIGAEDVLYIHVWREDSRFTFDRGKDGWKNIDAADR